MVQKQSIKRAVRIGTYGAAAILLCATPAIGQEPSRAASKEQGDACANAFKRAQESQQAGRLVEADQLYLSCADTACGAPLWQECATRNTQLRSVLPSVVPLVTDDAGEPRVDVEVKLDGKPFTSRTDGHGLPVDPGTHEFSFSNEGGVFATARVTIVRGQRNRPITVSLRSAAGPGSGAPPSAK